MTAATADVEAKPRTGRGSELFLLFFAVLVVMVAEAIADGTRDGSLDTHALRYGAALLVVGLVAHIVVRRVAEYADPVLLPAVILLNGLGLVMIHRLDIGIAQAAADAGFDKPAGSAGPQIVWTAVGLGLFVAVLVVVRDHRVLARFAYTFALLGLIALAIPALLPARFSEVNGARIWIRVAGFSIQPGEFAKIGLVIFAAGYLVAKRDVLSLAGRHVFGIALPRGRDLGPIVVAWLVSIAVLVRGRDMGTSLMFFGLFVVLIYVATERVSWVVIGLLLFAGGAYVAYRLFGHVQERVTVWLHAFQYENDIGYQVTQSLFGLGTGGLFGTGLGAGRPENVPVAQSDFILASFGEELGLFGLVGLIAVYGVIIARGFSASMAVRDSFGKLLAGGLAFSLGLQLFVVGAGISRLLPETGLTTPYLSYGGSSLVANYALLALLLRVSDAARRPAVPRPAEPVVVPAEPVPA
jgi:cell division protein FtsW (lipid II flippase)